MSRDLTRAEVLWCMKRARPMPRPLWERLRQGHRNVRRALIQYGRGGTGLPGDPCPVDPWRLGMLTRGSHWTTRVRDLDDAEWLPRMICFRHLRRKCARSARCADCRVDVHAIDEYFMLHDSVWFIATRAPGRRKHPRMLCIGCTEERLKRRLIPSDFTRAPINHGSFPRSKRMIDRVDAEDDGVLWCTSGALCGVVYGFESETRRAGPRLTSHGQPSPLFFNPTYLSIGEGIGLLDRGGAHA
jgi:hypothetical protein